MKVLIQRALVSLGLILALSLGVAPFNAQSAGSIIYEASDVDKAPVAKRRIKPDYPSALKKRETPAEVTIRFIVTTEGKVAAINIVKFNDPDIIDAVYAAYEKAKFEPGEKNGQPVNTRMEVTAIYPEPKPPKKSKQKDDD